MRLTVFFPGQPG